MPLDRTSLISSDYGSEAHNGHSNMDLVTSEYDPSMPYQHAYDASYSQEYAPYQQEYAAYEPGSYGSMQQDQQQQQRFQSTSTDGIDKNADDVPPPYWQVASPSAPPPDLPDEQRVDYVAPSSSSSFVTTWLKIILLKHWWPKAGFVCLWLPAAFTTIFAASMVIFGDNTWILVFMILSAIWLGLGGGHFFIQTFCNSSARYLSNKKSTVDSYTYIDSLKREAPRLFMSVSCYHYETRVRTVHYTDAQGRSHTRLETYQERVNTYSETTYFPYAYWVDASGVFRLDASFLNKKFIKMKLFKKVIFNDDETAAVYLRYSNEFRSAHRWRDVFMDYSEGMEIAGFKDRVLASVGNGNPIWVGYLQYLLASMFCMGCFQLPYLWCFEAVCGSQQFTVFKRVSLHPYVDMSQSAQHDHVIDIADIHFRGNGAPQADAMKQS